MVIFLCPDRVTVIVSAPMLVTALAAPNTLMSPPLSLVLKFVGLSASGTVISRVASSIGPGGSKVIVYRCSSPGYAFFGVMVTVLSSGSARTVSVGAASSVTYRGIRVPRILPTVTGACGFNPLRLPFLALELVENVMSPDFKPAVHIAEYDHNRSASTLLSHSRSTPPL